MSKKKPQPHQSEFALSELIQTQAAHCFSHYLATALSDGSKVSEIEQLELISSLLIGRAVVQEIKHGGYGLYVADVLYNSKHYAVQYEGDMYNVAYAPIVPVEELAGTYYRLTATKLIELLNR